MLDVANVVWCTVFRQVFAGSTLPVFGARGWRVRCACGARAPGLFFCGLAFQYAVSLRLLPGVGRDAVMSADNIEAELEDHWRWQPESCDALCMALCA